MTDAPAPAPAPGPGPGPSPEPAVHPAARKKSGSGCLMALGIFFGLGFIIVGGVGFMCYRVAEESGMADMVGAVSESFNAPGRKELEDAGCWQAVIMDMQKFRKLAESANPDVPKEQLEHLNAVRIQCAVGPDSPPELDCKTVATVYRAAVPTAPEMVSVIMSAPGAEGLRCNGRFNAAGERVGDVPMDMRFEKRIGSGKPGFQPGTELKTQ